MEGWAVFVTALTGLVAAAAGLIQALYPGGIRGLASHGPKVEGETQSDARAEPPTRLLRAGLRGPDVIQWQRLLREVRLASLETDGIFGHDTAHATRRFQESRGLSADAVVGPDTRAEMQRALRERPLGPRSRGPAVAEWQQQLNQAMGADLDEDGRWGPETRRATVAFQRRHGLEPDGLVGGATRQAMRKAIDPGGSTTSDSDSSTRSN